MQLPRLTTIVLILCLLSLGAACGGKGPGSSADQAQAATAAELYEKGNSAQFVSLTGAALTGYHVRTLDKPGGSTVEGYYFPVVPVGFDAKKDQVKVIVHAAAAVFDKETLERKQLLYSVNAPTTLLVKKSGILESTPKSVRLVFTSSIRDSGYDLKLADSLLTYELMGPAAPAEKR